MTLQIKWTEFSKMSENVLFREKIFLWKDWCWGWNSNTLATSCKELTHWKRLWCWEGLGAGGEGHNRGWDGWMASLTRWMWVWVNSGSWWWIGRPGVLWFMGLQRVGHDWVTELRSISWASQVVLVVKNLPANSGDIRDAGSIPRSGRSPRERHGNPLQYSCLGNPMDRGAWWATVYSAAKSQTRPKWLSTQACKHQLFNISYWTYILFIL